MLGAECEVQPGLVFELVQPLDGTQHLQGMARGARRGRPAHRLHDAFAQADSDAFKRAWEARGAKVLMGGRIGDTIEFYYLDTEPMLNFVARVRQRACDRPDAEPRLPADLTLTVGRRRSSR